MLRAGLVFVGAIAVLWLAFIVLVWSIRPGDASLRDAVGLLPDTLRLVRRLAVDRAVPRRTRWLLWVLLAYLASPVDLVPDFLPVIGYADDAIVTSFVLRHVVSRAGPAKLDEHWPGTPEGLVMLLRLLRIDGGRTP